ncbi:MAG: UDP-3-O-acyl-N-acetylglucosamine deacetylase [Acetobacter sp.]
MESFSPDPVVLTETDSEEFSPLFRDRPAFPKLSNLKPDMLTNQATLRSPITCSGVGLHTGRSIKLRMEPAPAGTGIVFQRTDIAASPILARYDNVVETRLSTVIGDHDNRNNRVATIEHLMSALSGKAIDNAKIFVDGPEVPVLDGSAADFLFLLDCAGRLEQDTPRREIIITRPVRVQEGDAFAELHPLAGNNLSLHMTIDFPARAIGRQCLSLHLSEATFRQELSFSRTFTNRQEIDALQASGLARGGSLDNAIVVDEEKILNPTGLRKTDEFVRHKLLDAVGDLFLAGARLRGTFVGHKSGHHLNNQLLRTLFADQNSWREISGAKSSMETSRQAA